MRVQKCNVMSCFNSISLRREGIGTSSWARTWASLQSADTAKRFTGRVARKDTNCVEDVVILQYTHHHNITQQKLQHERRLSAPSPIHLHHNCPFPSQNIPNRGEEGFITKSLCQQAKKSKIPLPCPQVSSGVKMWPSAQIVHRNCTIRTALRPSRQAPRRRCSSCPRPQP